MNNHKKKAATAAMLCMAMAMPFGAFADGAKQLIAAGAVVALHLLKRNTLLSIAGGTALYMILIRI